MELESKCEAVEGESCPWCNIGHLVKISNSDHGAIYFYLICDDCDSTYMIKEREYEA